MSAGEFHRVTCLVLDSVVIAHADLPFADYFERVLAPNVDAVIVPDRHNDGNPVFALPSTGPFTFAYGPGSCAAHHTASSALGWNTMILRDHALGFDIDEPDDLALSQYNISPDR